MPASKKPLNVKIGARIKAAREQAHLTQEKLAEKVGVSVQYVSDLERGKVGASVSTVIRLSQTLQISCDYLLLGIDDTVFTAGFADTVDWSKEKKDLAQEFLHLLARIPDVKP